MKDQLGGYKRVFGSGPLGLALSVLLLISALVLRNNITLPSYHLVPGARLLIFAIALALTLAMVLWAFRSLPSSRRGRHLSTNGAYRYVRHPLYAAFLTFFDFGLAILLDHWIFVLWAILLHPLWNILVRPEERLMFKLFGDKYVRYSRKTGKFLPRLGSIFSPQSER